MSWPGSNACTRSRNKLKVASIQKSSQLGTIAIRGEPATSARTPLIESNPTESGVQINTRSCIGGLERYLEQSHWLEAVAQACYQGSSLCGSIRVDSVSRNRTVAIDVPPQLRNDCWIAVIAKDGSPSVAVTFELVDSNGARFPFGSVTNNRNVLPASGPYCSVGGRIHQLAVTTNSDVSVVFQLAWYSAIRVEMPMKR